MAMGFYWLAAAVFSFKTSLPNDNDELSDRGLNSVRGTSLSVLGPRVPGKAILTHVTSDSRPSDPTALQASAGQRQVLTLPSTECQALCWALYVYDLQVRGNPPYPQWPQRKNQEQPCSWLQSSVRAWVWLASTSLLFLFKLLPTVIITVVSFIPGLNVFLPARLKHLEARSDNLPSNSQNQPWCLVFIALNKY